MTRQSTAFRYVSRRSGIVVLIGLIIFFAAVFQAGVLKNLFKSDLELRVILPASGLSGLSVGSKVEILGTEAGQIEKIVLDPQASFYAVVRVNKSVEPFIRADSAVFMRKQFVIAGTAYLEVTRGQGDPLDWDYAVLKVTEETGAADGVTSLVGDIRGKILPILDDTHRTIKATAQLIEGLNNPDGGIQSTLRNVSAVTARIEAGKGNVGRILNNDTLASELETTVTTLRETMSSVSVIMGNLEKTTQQVAGMTSGFSEQSQKLPEMMNTMNGTLKSLNDVMAKVGKTVPEITNLVRNSAQASNALPALLAQTQQTLAGLEQLLAQLQGNWLLGGSGSQQPNKVQRLSPIEARP
jgi:phospholipid/cholesterol/gamma-HCH transport system substrate-binding protein